MVSYCGIPKKILCLQCRCQRHCFWIKVADFLYPCFSEWPYRLPFLSGFPHLVQKFVVGAMRNGQPLFFAPTQQYSVMPTTLKTEQRKKQSTPLHTCPSYENARLRLTFLRLTIMSWMEATIRSEFPEATKTRSRLRKLPPGRVRYCASVRSHGVYLSFSTYSLTAFSAAVSRAGAKHRIHHTAHYE